MKVVPSYKFKYDGAIRKPDIPFEAKDDDVSILCRVFGCRMLESSSDAKQAEKTSTENAQENRVKSASKRKIQTTVDNYIAEAEKAQDAQNNAEIIDSQKPAKKGRKKKETE